jgi:hypothetical protein
VGVKPGEDACETAVRATGLASGPGITRAASVRVSLTPDHRVRAITTTVPVSTAGHTTTIVTTTSFSHFDEAAPVEAPI